MIDYIEWLNHSFPVCQPCKEQGIIVSASCVAHVKHLGRGASRKKENVRHYTGIRSCQYCHDLLDGRINKYSGADHFKKETGVDVWQIVIDNNREYWAVSTRHVAFALIEKLTGKKIK